MSQINIVGNASGTGTFTLKSGDSFNNIYKQSLPDVTGTLVKGAKKTIINTWHMNKSDVWSTTGWAWADIPDFDILIKPKSARSKFFIQADVWMCATYWGGFLSLVRETKLEDQMTVVRLGMGTPNHQADCADFISAFFHDQSATNTHGITENASFDYLDNPGTDQEIRYKLQAKSRQLGGARTTYINRTVPDRNGTNAEFDDRFASRFIITEFEDNE